MGDTSAKVSETRANMGSQSSQDVWGGQSPYLQNLYGSGQNLSGDPGAVNRLATSAGVDYSNQVLGDTYEPLRQSFMDSYGATNPLANSAKHLQNPLIDGLTNIVNSPGATFAEGGNNPLLDANVAMALEQASQNFNRNIAPNIRRDAIAQGQFGGSRGDLALGTAAGDANQDALYGAMKMYGDQYASDRAANLLSQRQNDATRLGAAQQIQQIMDTSAGQVGQGAQVGSMLQNLGMGRANVLGSASEQQWLPLMQYADLLGGPTVLGDTQAVGQSASWPLLGGSGPDGEGGGVNIGDIFGFGDLFSGIGGGLGDMLGGFGGIGDMFGGVNDLFSGIGGGLGDMFGGFNLDFGDMFGDLFNNIPGLPGGDGGGDFSIMPIPGDGGGFKFIPENPLVPPGVPGGVTDTIDDWVDHVSDKIPTPSDPWPFDTGGGATQITSDPFGLNAWRSKTGR